MNVYEIITEQILDRLNKGEIPWHRPWIGGEYPKNLISKKEYRGINVFLLGCYKYANPYWLSFKQAQELGGRIKAGEKSTMVVFWKQYEVQNKDNPEKKEMIPLLRYYRVFNLEQCEGIDEKKIPQVDKREDFQPLEICEEIVNGMPNRPPIKHEESRAYYSPINDFVNMPNKNYFDKPEFYYSVLFHELGHSTGHEKRLARKKQGEWSSFGSEKYSKEELCAEMTASFLCGKCQIENLTLENSVAYIQNWLKVLKNDSKMVVLAAAQAQKAADYILGITHKQTDD